jgi:hypothetical protein
MIATSSISTAADRQAQGKGASEPVQCGTCRGKLTKLPCLMCRLKHRKELARFPAVEIPAGVSASERRKLELSLAGVLPIRIANTLDKFGIRTVCDVLHRTQRELLAVPDIGVENLKQILRALEQLKFDTTKGWQALNRRIAGVRKRG